MLKNKYRTTHLIEQSERAPLQEVPAHKPTPFRFLWIQGKVLQLLGRYLWLKVKRVDDPKRWALEIRRFVESMGGLWIKMGQVLAMRNDIFSLEFCNELAKLQDQAFAFPAEESVRIIEENLGRPVGEVFEEFETRPFAAASLSQVHRARIRRTKIWVAIKVQRPHARSTFHYDLWWMARMFGLLKWLDFMSHWHWAEMLTEIRDMMEEELDYRQEAASMRQFRKTLRRHKVYVPKVFLWLSTDKLLVMEYIDGVFMSDFVKMHRNDPERLETWMRDNDIKPVKVARRLFHSQLRQIYEDLLFHGDLHPGNIVLLRKNRLAFIDFGNAGRFNKEFAHTYDQYLRAFSNGEMSTAADIYLVMAGKLSPDLDIARVKRDLIKAFHKHQVRSRLKNLPFNERSLAGNAAELSQIAARYKFEMNWNLLKMGRALGTIDQNIGVLYPEVDYNKETDKYMKAKTRRERKNKQLYSSLPELVSKVNNLSTLLMPTVLSKALHFGGMISTGTRTLAFVGRAATRVFWLVLIAAAWIYLYQHHNSLVDDPDDLLVLGTDLHDEEHGVIRWIDTLPRMSKVAWFFLVAVAAVVNYRLISYVRNLRKDPTRLPGESLVSR